MNRQNLNRFFNRRRWSALLSADLRLNGKRYLLTLAGAMVVIYLALLVLIYDSLSSASASSEPEYAVVFFMGLLALAFFIGNSFPELNSKTKTANYLLLPASTFEKLLTQALIYIILGTIGYILFFWIDAHLARWTVLLKPSVQSITPFSYTELWTEEFPNIFLVAVTSIVLYLFSIRLFFRRYALIKSIITLFGLFLLWMACMVAFSHLFYPETEGIRINLSSYKVYKDVYNVEIYSYILACCVCLSSILLAYFKLKEKKL